MATYKGNVLWVTATREAKVKKHKGKPIMVKATCIFIFLRKSICDASAILILAALQSLLLFLGQNLTFCSQGFQSILFGMEINMERFSNS